MAWSRLPRRLPTSNAFNNRCPYSAVSQFPVLTPTFLRPLPV